MKTIKLFAAAAGFVQLILATTVFARQNQDIKITFDSESARATINAFGKSNSDDELSRIAGLYGNQRLIKQTGRFDKQATEENFKLAFKQIAEKERLETDTFAFNRVKARLAATGALLDQIEKEPGVLINAVKARMSKYAPADLRLDVKVYFIVGGTSDGFAPDSSSFYMALDYFEDDFEGLALVMAHELYHNVQVAVQPKRLVKDDAPRNAATGMMMLQNTLKEGTASVVGDPLEIQNPKGYTNFFQGKFRRNIQRIEVNFALLDTILYRAYHDPQADSGKLYNIGFSGMFDSALYFVGYRMARVIEKHKGKESIAALIGENPLRFFNQYVEIYKNTNDPEAVRFSQSTEEILQKLASEVR